MAKRIKGITIELDGETKGLEKALQDVNKRSFALNKELRDVERLLKFDPGNTEAVAQKQRLLAQQVENTRQKLDQLRDAERQVQQQFERGDIGEEQYRAFRREVEFTEAELKKFERRLEQVDDTKSLDQVEKDVKDVKQETDKARKSMSQLGSSMKNVAKDAATMGAAGAAAVGALVEGMEDYNTVMARLKTNASQADADMDAVNEAFREMKLASEEADSSVEAVSNLIASGFDTKELEQATQAIAGAAIKWSDTLNVEGLSDAVQETIASGQSIGQFDEMLSRAGVDLEAFNTGLEEATANGQAQQYVLETLTNLGLANYFDAYKEGNPELIAQKEAQQELTEALADLSITLSPLVATVTSFLADIVKWINTNIKLVKSFDSISEGLEAVFDNLADQAAPMIETIAKGIIKNIPKLVEIGIQILQNIIQGISNAIPQLLQVWQQLLQIQTQNIMNFLPQLIELGIQLIQSLVQGLGLAYPVLLESFLGILTALINVIVENLPLVLDAGMQILTTLAGVITENLPLLIEAGIEILNALIDGIIEIFPSLAETGLNLIILLFETLIDNLPTIIDAGIKILNAVIEGIVDLLPELIKTGIKLIIELAAALIAELPTIIEAGIEIIFALIDGLIDAIPDLIAAIPEVVAAIFEAFGEVDWMELGTNIIEGMVEGVKNIAWKLVDAVGGVVNDAISWAENLLGISSPSKVFMQIGEFTGEGFVSGMEKMAREVEKASSYMTQAAIPDQSMQIEMPQITTNQNNQDELINAIYSLASRPVSVQINGREFVLATRNDISRELQQLTKDAKRGVGVR